VTSPSVGAGRTRGPLSFNLFEMNTVGHISHGLWRIPGNSRQRYTDLDFWQEHARTLEAGLFDTVFLADVIGAYDGYRMARRRPSERRCRSRTAIRSSSSPRWRP